MRFIALFLLLMLLSACFTGCSMDETPMGTSPEMASTVPVTAPTDPCQLSHTYDKGQERIKPGSDERITVYICINCGHTRYEPMTEDGKNYRITVEQSGDWHKLYNVPDSAPSGTLVRIFSGKIMDADLVVKVNGTEILCEDTEDQWCYEFIMPQEDVVITAEIEGGI